MKPLYILKIGGSVATYKNRRGSSVRKNLLQKIALSIKKARKRGKFDIIIIHGAGAGGHQIAKKYNLKEGARKFPDRWYGSLISRIANQELNKVVTDTFIKSGLMAVSVHTASVVIQSDKKIKKFNFDPIRESLKNDCIPVLYGEMVFDDKLGMTICSGDSIAPYLARKMRAEKIIFATDVDGIFTKDPHIHKDAEIIENVKIKDIHKAATLGDSHNVDVTNGLFGKMEKIIDFSNGNFTSVEIFNGLDTDNYEKILIGKKFLHTKISK